MVRIRDTKLVFSLALALLAAKDLNKLLLLGGVPDARLLLLMFILARLIVDVLVCRWLLLKVLKLLPVVVAPVLLVVFVLWVPLRK